MTTNTPSLSTQPIRAKICVAGSSNMDLVTTVSRMPVAGETILGKGFKTVFGGKGANQAVIAAKLGAEVTMIAKVGDDAFGVEYLENYRSVGLDTRYIRQTATEPTGIAAITVDDAGKNSIIVVAGANGAITPAEIEASREGIRDSKVAIAQLEIPLESTIRFLEIAREENVMTVFNPAPAMDLPTEIYPLCDFFCPNEVEAGMMSGVQVETIEDAQRAAAVFLERGVKAVLMTLGGNGSLYTDGTVTEHVPARKVQAVDTTGAGDCFLGSFATFLASGDDVVTAMRKATLVASISVQRPGAQTAYPSYDEVDFSEFA